MSLLHRVLLQPIITYFSLQNLQMIIWIISWLFVVFIDHYSFNSLLFICFLFIIIIIIIISTLPASVSRFSLQISNSQQGFSSISLLKTTTFLVFCHKRKVQFQYYEFQFSNTQGSGKQDAIRKVGSDMHGKQTPLLNSALKGSIKPMSIVHPPSWRKHHWILCSAMHS